MVIITDYCGLFSGNKVDKSQFFKTFYSKHRTASMISKCPINLERKLLQTLEFDMNEAFIGEIVEAYAEEQYLTNNLPDIQKINPIIFAMHANTYWKVGEHVARAWDTGKKLKLRENNRND